MMGKTSVMGVEAGGSGQERADGPCSGVVLKTQEA